MANGFTLVEMLLATALSASLAISCGSWLLHLQQQSRTTHEQNAAARAVLVVATQIQQDLQYQDPTVPLDIAQVRAVITADPSAQRLEIMWQIVDRTAIRRQRSIGATRWSDQAIASPIDSIRLRHDDRGRWTVKVESGRAVWKGPVFPMGDHAP